MEHAREPQTTTARQLILVGGFLGAGKTTLLGRAAERLAQSGRRVGLVTNDQAANLVDTALLESAGSGRVREVAGGCFCCRFADFVAAAEGLVRDFNPDTLLGEPVGSCTDISATVIQPLKRFHAGEFRVAPFTVLVDPLRTLEALNPAGPATLPGNVLYIFRKQLEEADLVAVNKVDATPAETVARVKRLLAAEYPNKPVLEMSALSGEGIDDWLAWLDEHSASGVRIAEVDYDEYADGEAALGWLNARVELTAAGTVDWAGLCRKLLEACRRDLAAASAEIAHLKLRLAADGQAVVANLTSTLAEPSVRGSVDGGHRGAELLINARVRIGPDELEAIVQRCLGEVAGSDGVELRPAEMASFAPARPEPTHRFDQIVVLE